MDFANLDTVAASEAPVFAQLESPTDGTPLVTEDKEPIGFNVLGRDSVEFRAKENRINDARMEHSRKGRPVKSAAFENQSRTLIAHVCTPVRITLDGEPLANDEAAIAAFFDRFPWAYDQMNYFIGERANFLTDA